MLTNKVMVVFAGASVRKSLDWIIWEHNLEQMIRQRVYQMAAGYEDCNDADFLRVDPV